MKQIKKKKIGDEVLQPLPSFDFGRIAAQTAKQVITFNVREAERERQYNEFKDKKDDPILNGFWPLATQEQLNEMNENLWKWFDKNLLQKQQKYGTEE